MFVALSRNVHPEAPTLLASCLAPGPREFVTAAPSFPAECRHVLQRVNPFAHLLAITTHATAAKPRHLPLCCHGTARRRNIQPPSTTIRLIRSVFSHSLAPHRRGAPQMPRMRFCRLDRRPRRFFASPTLAGPTRPFISLPRLLGLSARGLRGRTLCEWAGKRFCRQSETRSEAANERPKEVRG
jgi:hypothetical protein